MTVGELIEKLGNLPLDLPVTEHHRSMAFVSDARHRVEYQPDFKRYRHYVELQFGW